MTDQFDGDQNPGSDDVEVEPALPNDMPPSPAPAAPAPTAARVRSPRGAAPQGTGAAAPIPEKNKGGRPKGKVGETPETQWSARDIDVLWPEVIAWLATKGLGPHDVKINVIKLTPPPREQIGVSFEGQAAAGAGETPVDALMRIVTDFYHLPVAHGPVEYELQIVWRANGHYVANGQLRLGNPQEIITLRNAALSRLAQVGQQVYQAPAPGLGVPPMQPPPYAPPYATQPHANPPPTPSSSGESEEVKALRAELARMKESEEMRALREENARLRQGYSQPGFGRPPPQPQPQLTPETLAVAIAQAIKAAGLGAPQPAAPAKEEPDSISAMRKGLELLREFKKFGNEAQDMFDPADPDPPTPTLGEPPKPEAEEMPYDIWEVGSKWGDGSPAKLVRDKETGGIDLLGLALANPYPSQRIMEAAAKFMERFGQKSGLGGPPEEEQQQQLPPPAEAHAPDPPPSPNGQATEPGWDNLS